MSLDTLKKDELEKAAVFFGSDISRAKTNKERVAILVEDGVTYEQYRKFLVKDEDKPVAEREPEPAAKDQLDPAYGSKDREVLLKMDRENHRYDVYGFTFTKTHPFQLVPENVATLVLQRHQGFHIATPLEAQEYYG